MYEFVSGGIMALCWVIACLFAKFWRRTQDRLFAYFALAFAVLGLERLVLVTTHLLPHEDKPEVYLMRLSAFILILCAIADKNWSRKASP